MSDYYAKKEAEAVEEVKALLARPQSFSDFPSSDEFDPWEIFPFYGSYSSAFDDMALQTLENILDGNRREESLAHEMFREVLCHKNLCDYGTSPRVCFPTSAFKELLPQLIENWKHYYKVAWGEEYKRES